MTDLPDPVARALQSLVDRVSALERALEELRRLPPPARLSSAEPVRAAGAPGEVGATARDTSQD
jgi:hypothetical protein